MGAVQKLGKFLGMEKFGQGIATTIRNFTGESQKDVETQEIVNTSVQKLLYAARQEKDPGRRTKLLEMAQGMTPTPLEEIDPGLKLTNKEILGSAASTALNIVAPGGFSGGAKAVIAKNAALGAGYGAASGLEKNRSAGNVVGSTVGGAITGAAIGAGGLGLKIAKQFIGKTTPEWLMNNAIKPTLDEARKSVKFGNKTLGEELLQEGVKGSPEKLLQIADDKLNTLEDELQNILNSPSLAEARITRDQLLPYADELLAAKAGVPGSQGDVSRIRSVLKSIPDELTLADANVMKRRIYTELRDVSYKLDAKLSTKAAALKAIARGLKTEIENTVGGTVVSDINRKMSIYGRLEQSIVDQLARSMKNNNFGLTDAILAAGGVASMTPLGMLSSLGIVGIRHSGKAIQTGAAQGLKRVGNVGSGAIGGAIKAGVRRTGFNLP